MNEEKFWNEKYLKGGSSGRGSIGIYRNWKWNKIRDTIGLSFTSLIDVGCGDLTFWNHPLAKRVLKQRVFEYVGIDISEEIIKRNKEMHSEAFKRIYSNMKFIVSPAHIEINRLRSQVVFVLDLLFHIMKEGEFELILENCCRYANQFLIIYSWSKNPFEQLGVVTDGISQYYRNLDDYIHIFNMNDFQLMTSLKIPFDPYGRMYFFRREIY